MTPWAWQGPLLLVAAGAVLGFIVWAGNQIDPAKTCRRRRIAAGSIPPGSELPGGVGVLFVEDAVDRDGRRIRGHVHLVTSPPSGAAIYPRTERVRVVRMGPV